MVLLFSTQIICTGQKNPSQEIKTYVEFLNDNDLPEAKEYILSLWKNYDIVVFGERFHGEVTQYDLLLDIIRDERFINEVGNIFTEVGSVSIQTDLNSFLHTRYLTEEQRKADLLEIYRNLTFSPCWEKYNFFHFLSEINKLNAEIQDSTSIHLYPLSWEFPGWKNFETSAEYKAWFYKQHDFDSVMAANFIKRYAEILADGGSNKALIILNYRHAFAKDVKNEMYEKTMPVSNAARFIFDHYKGRVANILMNTWTSLPVENSDIGDPFIPFHDGKWDAAFKFIHTKSLGFDFGNSPFGEDSFDLWPYSKAEYKYKDVFTGFVFYLPLGEHYELYGIPGIVSGDFKTELKRRLKIFQAVWNYDRQGQKSAINKTVNELNKLKKEKYYKYKQKSEIIDKWLEE